MQGKERRLLEILHFQEREQGKTNDLKGIVFNPILKDDDFVDVA